MSNPVKDEDREFLLSSLLELEKYLASDTLYWRMNNHNMPLTPGNFLLLKRIYSLEKSDFNNNIEANFSWLLKSHRRAWQKKCLIEFPARMNQWRNLVEDTLESFGVDSGFKYNVRNRVILTMLNDEIGYMDNISSTILNKTDEKIFLRFNPGAFLWDAELASGFPITKFPFLYIDLEGGTK